MKLFLGAAWLRSCWNDSSGRSEVIFTEIINQPASQWGVCLGPPLGIIGYYFVLNSLPDGFLLNDFQTFCCSCHWIFHVSRRTSCSSAFKLNVHIRVTSGALTIERNSKWIKIYRQVNYVPMCQLQALAHCNAQMSVLWRATHVSCRTAVELTDWLTDWLTSNLSGESHVAMGEPGEGAKD